MKKKLFTELNNITNISKEKKMLVRTILAHKYHLCIDASFWLSRIVKIAATNMLKFNN